VALVCKDHGVPDLHRFLREQREEGASMTERRSVVERGGDDVLHIREHPSRASGGAL
jgi:hypothetical protein